MLGRIRLRCYVGLLFVLGCLAADRSVVGTLIPIRPVRAEPPLRHFCRLRTMARIRPLAQPMDH